MNNKVQTMSIIHRMYSINSQEVLHCIKIISFHVWLSYFVWNFKSPLWNSTQNILPLHWKICILWRGINFRAVRFKKMKYIFETALSCFSPFHVAVAAWRAWSSRRWLRPEYDEYCTRGRIGCQSAASANTNRKILRKLQWTDWSIKL